MGLELPPPSESDEYLMLVIKNVPAPLISFVTHGRNDGYMGDFLWRLATCIDKIAENYARLGLLNSIEILVADWGGHLGPLHESISLSDSALQVTRFAAVSPATAAIYNGDGIYSYAAAANVAIRRARGQFVFSMDSDAYMPIETAELLWKAALGEYAGNIDLERCFFWLSRKHIPYQFIEKSPTIDQLDSFVLNREDELIVTAKCNLETFRGGAVAIFAKKHLFTSIRGYDEQLIYWGWCDIDIHYRMAINFKPFDLWDLGGRMYHLEHYPQRGKIVGDRKLNPQVIPTTARVNSPDWGLGQETVALATFVAKGECDDNSINDIEWGLVVEPSYDWHEEPGPSNLNVVFSTTAKNKNRA